MSEVCTDCWSERSSRRSTHVNQSSQSNSHSMWYLHPVSQRDTNKSPDSPIQSPLPLWSFKHLRQPDGMHISLSPARLRLSARTGRNMTALGLTTHLLARLYVALDERLDRPERSERDDKAITRRLEGQVASTTTLERHRAGTFRFLDLPPDLRNCIYDYVFAPLDASTGIRIPLMLRKTRTKERLERKLRSSNFKRRSNLALLGVNRQIRAETSAYVWRGAYVTLHELDGAWKKDFLHLYRVIHGGRIGFGAKKLDLHIGDRLKNVRRLELTGIDTLYLLLRTNDDEIGQHFARREMRFMKRELEATKRRLIIARQALPNLECLVVFDDVFDNLGRLGIGASWFSILLFEPFNSPARLRIAFPELQSLRFQGREAVEEYQFCANGHWHLFPTGKKIEPIRHVVAQARWNQMWRMQMGMCSMLWM